MLKSIALVALTMALSAGHADAFTYRPDSVVTLRTSSSTITSRCRRSFYAGLDCTTMSTDNDMPQAAPVDMTPNTNPEWGKGCRSCDKGSVQ